MNALMKKSVKDVTRRKLRTLLTVIGIAVGIAGLAAINIASSQLDASFRYATEAASQPDIQFFTAPAPSALAAELARQPNVTQVEGRDSVSTRWHLPSSRYPFAVTGIADFGAMQFDEITLVEGQLPQAGQILLESSDRSITPLRVGDAVTLTVRGAERRLTISGFARTRGMPSAAFLGTGMGYMRSADFEMLFGASGPNTFDVKLSDYSQRAATARHLTQVFDAHQIAVLSAQVGHSDGGISQVSAGLFAVMRVLSIVAILLSSFLLLSTVTTLVTEQLPVIGMMKAVGATSGQVLRNYLTLVVIYGMLGTALGIGLGVLGGSVLVSFVATLFNVDVGPLSVGPGLILLCVAIGVGVPVVAALLPVYFGTRITVRQALSGYGLDGTTLRRAVLPSVGLLPQSVRLGMRSLFRKRARALLTLLALTISGASFLAVQTTADSFSTTLDQVLNVYDTDVFVDFSNPMPYSDVAHVLDGVRGIAHVERIAQHRVTSQWGDGLLTGVEPNATLYKKQVLSGRWFTADDRNVVVLSDKAASAGHLKVGDSVSFHDDLHSATWTIIGITHDDNGASMKFGVLLASVDQVNSFQHLSPDNVSSLLVQGTSRSATDVDALSARLDDALSAAGYPAGMETKQQTIQRNQGEFLILEVLLYAVAAIVAVVGAIGLSNTLAMSVLERRREVGILRSIGATGRRVAQVFWTEGITLGVVAWALAIVVGIPAAYGFVQLLGQLILTMPFAFNPLSLVYMLAFILVVATIASLGPVWGSTRIKIVQTLRYE
ncbi:MAG TPA: FtsX-like permease family protein [Ktedonobacterales bacterium]|nr:FtsX-like permease family protein [Ktedonobacterales bacterium]